MKARYSLIGIAVAATVAILFLHFHARHVSRGPVVHVENGFEFTAQAPYKVVAPLFVLLEMYINDHLRIRDDIDVLDVP